jgi:hypothetical protein
MLHPGFPVHVQSSLPFRQRDLVTNVEDQVNKRVRVVHPAQGQDNIRMVVGHSEGARLYDGRDQDGESEYEVGRRLCFNVVQLPGRHVSVPQRP